MVFAPFGKLLNIMFFTNKYKNKQEPALEPIFRELRFGAAKNSLKKILDIKKDILDFGCGPEAKFYSYLCDKQFKFKIYYGFDPLLKNKNKYPKNMRLINNKQAINRRKYDLVSMFAVLEHLDYPNFNYKFITDSIKPGGYLLITTPTKIAKNILEFLSYKLKIVSRREIEEHKHYFNIEEIKSLFKKYKLKPIESKLFELGMNNFVLFKKSAS